MEPWQLGATEAVELIRQRALSPLELTESLLGRVAETDGSVHAWVTVDAEGAIAQARAATERLAGGDGGGVLVGVPVAVKDVIHVKGLRTTASSKVLDDYVATADAACVTALRAADATILGKTHTAEFACADPPPTRNPWNLEHTPGGSSAGSAATVAAGAAPLALGTQTAGSTLRPAAYNGIVGYKATYGTISTRGVIPLAWSFDHVGILARSVRDAALVLGTLAGYDGGDPASSPLADGFRNPTLDLGVPPVIGLITSYFLEICEPEIYAHTQAVARLLESHGAQVREIPLAPSHQRIAPTAQPIMRAEAYAYHRDQFAEKRALYGPKMVTFLEEGRQTAASDYLLALRERFGIVADLEASLVGVDVALTPATPAPAPRNTSHTGDSAFQTPWSFAGLPTIALPSGVNPYGMPLGVQLVGPRWRDGDLLRAAQWCETAIGFEAHPPCWSAPTAQ